MASEFAAANVTAALRTILQDALDVSLPGKRVGTGFPSTDADTPVTILLYQATPNAGARTIDFPPRRPEQLGRHSTVLALDLHYLMLLGGPPLSYTPEKLLTLVLRAFERTPLITRALIERAMVQNGDTLPHGIQREPQEAIRIQQTHLGLDDLSRIWSMFAPAPYVLSVGYTCTAVMVDLADAAPT
jgi:hypothetical protein